MTDSIADALARWDEDALEEAVILRDEMPRGEVNPWRYDYDGLAGEVAGDFPRAWWRRQMWDARQDAYDTQFFYGCAVWSSTPPWWVSSRQGR